MTARSSSATGCDQACALRTRQQLLAHGAAFNQFAQTCLLQAADGEIDADSLFDAMQPMLHLVQLPFAFWPAGADSAPMPGFGADWLTALGPTLDPAPPGAAADVDQVLDFQAAVNECRRHWVALGQSARGEFRKRLERFGDREAGLLQIYRQWADAYEACYLRALRKPGFLRDHARLLNAAVALAELWRRHSREWSRRIGLPDPEEIDRLVRELDRLRRQARACDRTDANDL